MMVVVLVLGLTQAKLSGGNVNYNSEGWNESPATLDNNPEFLLALRGGRKKENLALRHDTARARTQERENILRCAAPETFFLLSLSLSTLSSPLFFLFFFSSELHVSRDQAE